MTHKKSDFRIRKAEMHDAETLARNNCLMAKETENKNLDLNTVINGVKAVIKDPHKGFFLVATIKGEIVGQLLTTYDWSDWRNKHFLWIQSVYVPEPHRKQGIYSSLYHYLKDLATERKDVAGLRLYVEKNNETAQRTYERLGMHDPGYLMYETLV
jgi:ribosomal protein S18 acetylase RimI-like enzyme